MKLYHIFEKSLSVIPQTAMPKTPIHEMIKKPITKQNKTKTNKNINPKRDPLFYVNSFVKFKSLAR